MNLKVMPTRAEAPRRVSKRRIRRAWGRRPMSGGWCHIGRDGRPSPSDGIGRPPEVGGNRPPPRGRCPAVLALPDAWSLGRSPMGLDQKGWAVVPGFFLALIINDVF